MGLSKLFLNLGLITPTPDKISIWKAQHKITLLIEVIKLSRNTHTKLNIINWFNPRTFLEHHKELTKIMQQSNLKVKQILVLKFTQLIELFKPENKKSLKIELLKAEEILTRSNNYNNYLRNHTIKNKASMLFDKSKMKRLAKVKRQLRKSIRLY